MVIRTQEMLFATDEKSERGGSRERGEIRGCEKETSGRNWEFLNISKSRRNLNYNFMEALESVCSLNMQDRING